MAAPASAQHQARERSGGFTGESPEERSVSTEREARAEPVIDPVQPDMLEEIKEAGMHEEQESSQQRLSQAKSKAVSPRKSTKAD